MAFQVIYRDQRLVQREGQRLRVADADQQSSGESRTLGDGEGVDRMKGLAGIGEGFANHRHDGPQMLARGQFRHHSAVRLMGGNLRKHHVRDDLLARAHHCGCGLIAGALDAENVGVGHRLILVEFVG